MKKQSYSIRIHEEEGVMHLTFSGNFQQQSEAYMEAKMQEAIDQKLSDIVFDVKNVATMNGRCLLTFHEKLSEIYETRNAVIVCDRKSSFKSVLFYLGFNEWFDVLENKIEYDAIKKYLSNDLDCNMDDDNRYSSSEMIDNKVYDNVNMQYADKKVDDLTGFFS